MKLQFIFIVVSIIYNPSVLAVRSNEVLKHLGSRTPYRFKYNKNDSVIKFPGCKAKKIWMMIRHGTRMPKATVIEQMQTTLKDLRYEILLQNVLGKGDLNEKQISHIQEWSHNLDPQEEKTLTHEGREEMILLAERMQNRFPDIIKNKYDNKTFLFKYTPTERTQQSARYFANGLFDQKNANDVIFDPATKTDIVLRFYKHCDKWQKQVKKNPDTYVEHRAFGVSQAMSKTLENVSKRLGLTRELSLDELKLIYKTCGYETAWNKHSPSPWCAAFDKRDAEVMEYLFDLTHYWKDGYGLELTYRQACVTFKNLFEHFSNHSDPKAVFFFAHSGTILKLIAHLGLYKPESHLTADSLNKKRPWKASDIDCFASNLAFVLFGCKGRDYVLTMHQERIIKLPMCESTLCPLDELRRHLNESIFNCNYNDICSLERSEL